MANITTKMSIMGSMLAQLLVPVAAVLVAVLVTAVVLVKPEKQLVGKYNTSFPILL